MSRSEKPEDDAEAVLKTLEESGVFDELRQQLLTQVKANVSFQTPSTFGQSLHECTSLNNMML